MVSKIEFKDEKGSSAPLSYAVRPAFSNNVPPPPPAIKAKPGVSKISFKELDEKEIDCREPDDASNKHVRRSPPVVQRAFIDKSTTKRLSDALVKLADVINMNDKQQIQAKTCFSRLNPFETEQIIAEYQRLSATVGKAVTDAGHTQLTADVGAHSLTIQEVLQQLTPSTWFGKLKGSFANKPSASPIVATLNNVSAKLTALNTTVQTQLDAQRVTEAEVTIQLACIKVATEMSTEQRSDGNERRMINAQSAAIHSMNQIKMLIISTEAIKTQISNALDRIAENVNILIPAKIQNREINP